MATKKRRQGQSASTSGSPKAINLDLLFGPTVYKFLSAAATGKTETGATAREIACFGTRGDGKTQGALGAMVAHAKLHQQAGFPLPCKWIGVTDTFASHKNKTVESLKNPMWQGLWTLHDGDHVAVFGAGGSQLINLHLFGIEDVGATDRVRTETVGVWFEEPAPAAVLVTSSGVNELSWATAITSQRIPSHTHPAIMTLNYPDSDHWTWQRFIAKPHADSAYYRVPPGERASAEQRAEWMKALEGRPDLQRRLLLGQPGVVQLGAQVATGFDEDEHVSREVLEVIENEPLFIGWDFWHTPTAIIAQEYRGTVRIYAALYQMGIGTRQLISSTVLPWLSKYAPGFVKTRRLLHGGDPTGATRDQSDTDNSPVEVIETMLGGVWQPGPVKWEARIQPGLAILQKRGGLLVDSRAKDFIQALSGRWYYPQDRLGNVSRDLPKKPNHPWEDIGDAWLYLINRIAPNTARQTGPIKVETNFDPWSYKDYTAVQVDSDFTV